MVEGILKMIICEGKIWHLKKKFFFKAVDVSSESEIEEIDDISEI